MTDCTKCIHYKKCKPRMVGSYKPPNCESFKLEQDFECVNSTTRHYQNRDGNECTLDWLITNEPGWAANRIKVGEDAIAKTMTFEQAKELLKSRGYSFDGANCQSSTPWIVLAYWKVDGGRYDFEIDGTVTVEELKALAVVLEAKNNGEF